MSAPYATSYMSRVIALPPLVARVALAACLVEQRIIGDRPARLHVHASLRLRDDWLLATAPATLARGRRRLHVELELSRWSSHRTELGLRPICRSWMTAPTWPGWPSETNLDAGHVILTELEHRLHEWAEAPLRMAFDETDPSPMRARALPHAAA